MLERGQQPIKGYRLLEFLGKGAYGEVWRTTAPGGASAALKFIDLRDKLGAKELRGVKLLKEIRNPNLMPVTAVWVLNEDFSEIDGWEVPDDTKVRGTLNSPEMVRPSWLVVGMLLGDEPLSDRLKAKSAAGRPGIPKAELLVCLSDAAKGIDFLNSPVHDLGKGPVSIQHCDIKPANIMLVGGSAVVCDFGLAQILEDGRNATEKKAIGTPAYISPECARGTPSRASDQYSLAITYYELRTDKLPLAEEDQQSQQRVIDAHVKGRLQFPALPPAEQAVMRKATALNPEKRYATASEFIAALRGTDRRRRGAWAALAAVAVTAVLGTLAVRPFLIPPAPPPVEKLMVTLTPADSQVWIDDEPQELEGGRLLLDPGERQSLTIQAAHELYESFQQTYQRSEWKNGLVIDLQRLDPQEVFAEASQLWRQGQTDSALEKCKTALRLDGGLQLQPAASFELYPDRQAGLAVVGGERLVTVSDRLVDMFDIPAEGAIAQPQRWKQNDTVLGVAISSDGHWVATGGYDPVVRLRQTDQLQNSERIIGQQQVDIRAIGFILGGRRILIGDDAGRVACWSLDPSDQEPRLLFTQEHGEGKIREILTLPDQRQALSMNDRGVAYLWDFTSDGPPTLNKTELALSLDSVDACLITPQRRLVVAGRSANDAYVLIQDLDDPQNHIAPLQVEEKIMALAVHAEADQESILAGQAEGLTYLWRLASAVPLSSVKIEAKAALPAHKYMDLTFLPGGKLAATAGQDAVARVWNLDLPTRLPLELRGHTHVIKRILVGPHDRFLITAARRILFWDLQEIQLMIQTKAALGLDRQSAIQALKSGPPGSGGKHDLQALVISKQGHLQAAVISPGPGEPLF